MPTSYTASIADGSDTSLRNYIMRIGRGMGFAAEQRDTPLEEPITRVTERTIEHYSRRLEKATARLAELKAMTPIAVAAAAQADFERAEAEWIADRDEKLAIRARYEAMIAAVEAWEPEELIAKGTGVKDYALSQLQESMLHDCGAPGREMKFRPRPQSISNDEWLRIKIEIAESTIESAQRHIQDAKSRIAETNRYIDAFLASLPPEETT